MVSGLAVKALTHMLGRLFRGRQFAWALALVGLLTLSILVVVAITVVPNLVITPSYRLSEADLLRARADVRTALLEALGGSIGFIGLLTILFGLFSIYRNMQVTAHTQAISTELARRSHVTDQFARAIDQIASDHLQVRVAAMYSLEQIANDSEDLAQPIVEVLSAYLREYGRRDLDGRPERTDARLTPRLSADLQAAVTVLTRLPQRHVLPSLDLHEVDLPGAALAGANLVGANLSGAYLGRADLRRADLTACILRGADLGDSLLIQANLKRSDLVGARFQDALLVEANLEEANLGYGPTIAGANFRMADLTRARLSNASLVGANFREAVLTRADLSSARANHANFTKSSLVAATLRNADLRDAQLIGADLSRANLDGCNLAGADLSDSLGLDEAQLKEAVLEETKLPPYIFNLA